MKYFLAFVFSAQITVGLAQDFKPGFIIDLEGNKIEGFVRSNNLASNGKVCYFKDSAENVKKYSPVSIKGFGLTDGYYYVSREIKYPIEKTVFLEYLVDGIYDLFYFTDGNEDYYYIDSDKELVYLNNKELERTSESGQPLKGKSEQYKGALKYLFQDAPNLFQEIETTGYTHNNLVKLTTKYHKFTCDDYDCTSYFTKTKPRIELMPFIGFALNSISIDTHNFTDIYYANSISFGSLLTLAPAKYHYNLIFGTGLLGYQYSFADEVPRQSNTPFDWIDAKGTSLRIPLFIEYNFAWRKFHPFFTGGIEIPLDRISVNVTHEIGEFKSIGDDSAAGERAAIPKIGIGLKYDLTKTGKLVLGLNTDIGKSKINEGIADFTIHKYSTNIWLGYSLHINANR